MGVDQKLLPRWIGSVEGIEDAASFHHLPRTPHRDPFDRMVIWQAIREKMILISKDTKLPAYQRFGLSILDG